MSHMDRCEHCNEPFKLQSEPYYTMGMRLCVACKRDVDDVATGKRVAVQKELQEKGVKLHPGENVESTPALPVTPPNAYLPTSEDKQQSIMKDKSFLEFKAKMFGLSSLAREIQESLDIDSHAFDFISLSGAIKVLLKASSAAHRLNNELQHIHSAIEAVFGSQLTYDLTMEGYQGGADE